MIRTPDSITHLHGIAVSEHLFWLLSPSIMLFDYKPANNHPNDTWIHVFSQALSFRQTAIIQTGQLLSLPLNVRTLLWEYAQYGDCLRESPVSNAWPCCKMIYAECVDIYMQRVIEWNKEVQRLVEAARDFSRSQPLSSSRLTYTPSQWRKYFSDKLYPEK